jgi:membrane-bound ClpP family serine protease
MLDWITILLLIFFGFGLIIMEIVVVPGTTIVGLLGLGLYAAAIFLTFKDYGAPTGFIVLGISGSIGILGVIYSLKSGVWKRFSLEEKIESKFNEEYVPRVKEGDVGVAISALRPFGTAEFHDQLHEVKTEGYFVKAGTKVRVVRVESQRIFVEPVNEPEA